MQEQRLCEPPATAASWQSPSSQRPCCSGPDKKGLGKPTQAAACQLCAPKEPPNTKSGHPHGGLIQILARSGGLRHNAFPRCFGLAGISIRGLRWWPLLAPSRRQVVNPVRPGREQRQQWTRAPGCGWQGLPPPFGGLSAIVGFPCTSVIAINHSRSYELPGPGAEMAPQIF